MGCGCSRQLRDVRLFEISCTMVDSNKKSEFETMVQGNEVECPTPSMSDISIVEEQIKRSKAHWSTLIDNSGFTNSKKRNFEMSNKQEFLDLQSNSTWGSFFANFSGDGTSTGLNHEDFGELVVGKKFAEGGQAELFEVQIKWFDACNDEDDRRLERKYVLKVFKEGTLLKHVKSQFPQGLLLQHVESMEQLSSSTIEKFLLFTSKIFRGVLLKGGRFAFFMLKRDFDLRTLIERNVKSKSSQDSQPFLKEDVAYLMFLVALGVEWLHNHDIVHRDLKASNILIRECESGWPKWHCFVADYECSVGIIGTDFFRAPEILQACKDRKVNAMPEVFSKAADVYSYGMMCYEILTGKLPFEDHPLRYRCSSLTDLVINEHLRPKIPSCVDNWIHELLEGCWQIDPSSRLSIGEVLNVLLVNSNEARSIDSVFREQSGEYYRIKFG